MPLTPQNTLPILTGPEILAKLTTILVELLHVDPEQVEPAAYFMRSTVPGGGGNAPDLGADSLDHLEITMAIEEEFALTIPDEDAENILTVQQAVDYLIAHKVF